MTAASVARYTGSTLEFVLAIALLLVAVVHAAAGVPTAVLPAAASLVLLGAAAVIAPVTRRRLPENVTGRGTAAVFLGALAVAAILLGAFIVLGRLA